jgi:hypothetical protein
LDKADVKIRVSNWFFEGIMHGPVRERLEDLLQAKQGQAKLGEHLAQCRECSSELTAMKSQAMQIAGLRALSNVEPSAGFYARVLQRIEECEIDSFWALFGDSPFGKRLAAASLTIALALGTYVVFQTADAPLAHQGIVAINGRLHYDFPVMGSQEEQRDAVLNNFAEHHFGQEQGQTR